MSIERKRRMAALLLIAMAALYLCMGLASRGDSCDGFYRWQESAYVLRGTDPFDVAAGAAEVDAEIGAVQPDAGNMPWTFLLNNCVYPGFLPFSAAFVVARVVFALLLCLTVCCMWRRLMRTLPLPAWSRALLMGVLFCCYMWFATLRLGNHGAYITLCIFLLLTFDHDRHWLAAGVLYAFIAMKPQLSGLFLLYFLLRGRWKALLTAGGILLAAWLAASALTGTPVLEMLIRPFKLCLSYEHLDNYIYYGLFDPLISAAHLPSWSVMIPSVLLWIGAIAAVTRRCRGAREELLYAVCALGAVSWMYVQPSDQTLMGLFALCCGALLLLPPRTLTLPERIALIAGMLLNALPLKGTVFMAGWVVPLLWRAAYLAIAVVLLRLSVPARADAARAAGSAGAPPREDEA